MVKDSHLDDFIEKLDFRNINPDKALKSKKNEKNSNLYSICLDDFMKQKILRNVNKRIRKQQNLIKYAAIACAILMLTISYFVPNTPVYALRQRILSYIPGLGVVESDKDTDIITGVLANPIRVEDGEKFIEIRSAYLKGNVLVISGLTNAGSASIKDTDNIKDHMEYFSGETSPNIYIIQNDSRIKATHQVWTGPSYETKTSKISVYFYLDQNTLQSTYHFEMEGLSNPVEIPLSPVRKESIAEEIGNVAMVDDVMIFANLKRENDITEVLVSIIAPKEFKHPRGYLFDHEKELFQDRIFIKDEQGVRYEADEDLRKQRDSEINTFYFHIPEDRKKLELIIPQILYAREYKENDIEINMSRLYKMDKALIINKTVRLGDHDISLDRMSLIPAGNDVLPEEFKCYDNLMIEASTRISGDSRSSILRIVPEILMGSKFNSSFRISQSVYAGFWNSEENSGYSIINFDGIKEARKILINLDAEISMTGPWRIPLE
jgi:hypothetical protein